MKVLLGLLVAFVIGDGLLTHLLVDGGMAREGNPLLVPLVGEAGFIVLKIAGALLCSLILWDIYRRSPRLAMTATICFVVVYGAILLWNSSVLIAA